MKNFYQLKPAFIVGVFLFLMVSCEREAVSPDPYHKEKPTSSSLSGQSREGGIGCGNSSEESHFISLEYAYQLVQNYQRSSKRQGEICNKFDEGGWVLAETFPVEVIQRIINQRGCCKFRIYNGLDTDNRQHLVIVGVNEQGSDILFCQGNTSSDPNGGTDTCSGMQDLSLIAEMGAPCPQACAGVYTGP